MGRAPPTPGGIASASLDRVPSVKPRRARAPAERTAARPGLGTDMHPEVRAIADRFMYEQATLKHITALVPEGGLRRPVPGMEWNVGQLLAHLALSLENYRELVHRWLSGASPLEGWDPDAINAETAARYESGDADELRRLFGEGIVGLVAALDAIPEGREAEPLGRGTAAETLRWLGGHAIRHAIPLIDAVPEVRLDPLVLNWLLYAEFEDDASRTWQAKLLADAREYLANNPPEEDEE